MSDDVIDDNGQDNIESGEFGRSVAIQMVSWRHPRFGEYRVEVTGFGLGETQVRSSNTWTPVLVNELGDSVTLDVSSDPKPGVLMFEAISSKLISCNEADPDLFVIPVTQGPGGAPSTREKDKDNFNLDFLEPKTGYLAVNQVSFVKRGDSYWMCFQQLYRGRIVKISREAARNIGFGQCAFVDGKYATIVPAHVEYAHRFANPWTMFPECKEMVEFALKNNACHPINPRHERPQWKPAFPSLPAAEELPTFAQLKEMNDSRKHPFAHLGHWDVGVVAWYNLVLGYGHVICKDGRHCFVHFRNIETAEGEMPILHPMQQVILRHREVEKEGGRKDRQATFVRGIA